MLRGAVRFFACAATLLTLSASVADSPWIYGIHWYGDPALGDVEAMTGNKPVWDLETVMLYDGGWSLTTQAAKFQAIANKGHSVVIRVQPRWGWSIPAAAERAQYLNDIQTMADQAKNFCHTWQIGNEMNLYAEYGGGVLSASEYIDFYKQIRARIKNVTSPLGPQRVLVGPVSPGSYIGEVRHTDGLVYLDQMCAALGSNDTDGFALHAYGAPWYDAAGATTDFHNGYVSQLSAMDNRGFADKPAYILEWNRQTNPITDAIQEAASAQFLINAYQDLKTWNANPASHPVVCAAWFIYPDMSGWEAFSIRKLRDYNPRGVGQDLWDSFQNACTQNIPAGTQTPNPATIVDNTAATFTGSWSTGTSAADKYGSDYRYKTAGTGAAYGEYRPNSPGGQTAVYAWWSQGSNRTTAAEFAITHSTGTSIVTQNEQTNGGKWNLLGTFNFTAGNTGYVRITDNFVGSGQVVMADALKFVTLTPADVIIDNNTSGFTASSNWSTGTSAADKYGADYRFRLTQAISDSATWTYTATQTRNYEVYAWWSAGSNRSATAPYVVIHSVGNATVSKNQQTSGGSWQTLGTYNMNAGQNSVKLSCWTTTGFVVVGDAIKVVAR